MVIIANAVNLTCSKPFFPFTNTSPLPSVSLCAKNLSVLEQLFKIICLGLLAIIAGSQVKSQRPCWRSRTKYFSPLGTKLYFYVNSSKRISLNWLVGCSCWNTCCSKSCCHKSLNEKDENCTHGDNCVRKVLFWTFIRNKISNTMESRIVYRSPIVLSA